MPAVRKMIDIPVVGAGVLRVSTSPTACGGRVGVSLWVSWGRHGDAGGVVPYEAIPVLVDALQAIQAEIQRRGGEQAVYRQISRRVSGDIAPEQDRETTCQA